MPSFDVTTNASPLADAYRNSPAIIERFLRPELDKSAKLIAREARRNARANGAMTYSTLINSINSQLEPGLEAIVFQGTDYGKYVEIGTRGGGYPPQQTVIDWLRVKRIAPRDPDMSEAELAYLIARKIALHGTPAKPFFEPAFNSQKDAAVQRVNAAVLRAMAEIG